jgi:hypothetical protein
LAEPLVVSKLQLRNYIRSTIEDHIERGDLAGIALTGLATDDGVIACRS